MGMTVDDGEARIILLVKSLLKAQSRLVQLSVSLGDLAHWQLSGLDSPSSTRLPW